MPVVAQISRDVSKDFVDTKEEPITKDEAFENILQVQVKGMNWLHSQRTYESWNGDAYDSQMLATGYKGPLWAVDYLVHLNLAKDIRILDVCCGTGLVARYLEKHGYTDVEALDASASMLAKAKQLDLYKAYHCCPIGDGNQAPLKAELFDVITVAGGFAEGHMKPDAFDEMLRLVKPGGYIINVMREENRRTCAIYKDSFDDHCKALVDAGKWELVYTHINPKYYMNFHGLVQVYRKAGKPLAKAVKSKEAHSLDSDLTPEEAFKKIMQVQIKGMNWTQSQDTYIGWNGKNYDDEMLACGYKAPEWVVEYLVNLNLPKDIKILDVCAGTGLVAQFLKPFGYTNIEALDASKEMLKGAAGRGYRKSHLCAIGGDNPPAPIRGSEYDVITVAGGFAEGHMLPSAFNEMLRLVKKGGYIINVMREENRHQCEIYKDKFDPHCQKMVEFGLWELVYEHVNEKYYMNYPGLVQVYKKGGRAWQRSGTWHGNAPPADEDR